MSSFKIFSTATKTISCFMNTGEKDGRKWVSISPPQIQKQDKNTKEWKPVTTWFYEDAIKVRALLDRAIREMENQITPVEKIESKKKDEAPAKKQAPETSLPDDDDIPF